MKRTMLAVIAAVVLVLALSAVAFATIGNASCTPEAREEATSSDVSQVLSGAKSLSWAYEREYERIEQCGA